MNIGCENFYIRHAGAGRHPRLFIFSFLFGAIFTGSALAAPQKFSYEPTKVQVSGTIILQKFYGPPNFGEDPKTDTKVDVLELKLDKPIDIGPASSIQLRAHHCVNNAACGSLYINSETYSGVTCLELVDLDYPAHHVGNFLSNHVTVHGELYERETGNQYTDVLIIVDSITKA
jgi:hypothetical protein